MSKALWFLFFTIFIDLLGIGILIPVIPLLLADPNSSYYLLSPGASTDYGYILLGILVATYPLSLFFVAPVLGQFSDKYGRKKVLIISLLGTVVSYIVFAYAIYIRNIPLLFFSRIIGGITGGNISAAQAAIADLTKPEDRAKNFGLIGAAFGLGFIIGPVLGGKLSDPGIVSWFSAPTPFIFSAILAFINMISVSFFFKETNKFIDIAKKIDFKKSITNIARAREFADERIIFLSSFLMSAGFTFFTTFFSVYLIIKFDFDQSQIGSFFGYVGLWIVITQALITRFVAKKWKEESVLKVVYFTSAFAMFLYFFPQKASALLFIVPLFAISNGLANANAVGLLSRYTKPELQGEILGINASVLALGQSIPPILTGFIAAILSPSAPLVISGLIIACAGIVFTFFYKRREET